MACFLVPMAEAVITDLIIRKMGEGSARSEKSAETLFGYTPVTTFSVGTHEFKWLSQLLWGVSLILMLEHLWTGEVTLTFPFLTALSSPEDTMVMLDEIATNGVTTAVITTLIWFATVILSRKVSAGRFMSQVR